MTENPPVQSDNAELDALIAEAWRLRSSDASNVDELAGRIETIARARMPENTSAIAAALCVRAYACTTRARYEEAIVLASDAQQRLDGTDDDYWKGAAAHIIAIGNLRLGKWSEAIGDVNRAIELRRAADTSEVSDSIGLM